MSLSTKNEITVITKTGNVTVDNALTAYNSVLDGLKPDKNESKIDSKLDVILTEVSKDKPDIELINLNKDTINLYLSMKKVKMDEDKIKLEIIKLATALALATKPPADPNKD